MAEKRYYPLFADLEGRRCLVVGAGSVGLEKVRGLADCSAEVTVVAPEADPEIEVMPVRWLARPYETPDLEDQVLVCAATADTEVNRRVFADAEARGILCNVADVPELCSFILPAIHREGPIAVAVSTSGASPALAQRIRDEVAARYGPDHAELARQLEALRPWAKENLSTYEARRDFFREFVAEALA
jgi:precorrin-2 dehydrogenase/sirohydrochlorin ferrochelatase